MCEKSVGHKKFLFHKLTVVYVMKPSYFLAEFLSILMRQESEYYSCSWDKQVSSTTLKMQYTHRRVFQKWCLQLAYLMSTSSTLTPVSWESIKISANIIISKSHNLKISKCTKITPNLHFWDILRFNFFACRFLIHSGY